MEKFKWGISLLLIFSAFQVYSTNSFLPLSPLNFNEISLKLMPFSETDSILEIAQKCSTDTAKFDVLHTFFWRYANKKLDGVKKIGNYAYEIIKNSKNLRALSDGYDIKGFILENEKKYDSAYIFFRKALEISKRIGYHSRTGWSYYHLGIINAATGHIDSAIIYLKILYNFNIDKNLELSAFDVLNEIANIYTKNEKTDSALIYLNKMFALSRQIKNKDQELKACFAFIDFYTRQNNTKKVLLYMNQALQLAEANKNNKALISIYTQIGDLFFNQKKNYDIALTYYRKVLEISGIKNKSMKSFALNMIGSVYLKEGKDSLALVNSLEALKLAQEIKFKHQVSEAFNNLGKIYIYQGKLNEAINNFKNCYATGCDKCPKIKFHDALVEIADSYLKLDNPEKALDYYNQSLKLAQDFDSDKELAISNLKIGNYYLLKNQNTSESFYLTALQKAHKSKDISTIKIIADTLSSYFRKKNNYHVAYGYQELSKTMQDSLIKIEQQESMANWELKFEFEKINKENEARNILSKEEIGRQKIFRNAALIISVLLAFLGIVIFLSYRRKNKDNVKLTLQRDEIIEKSREIELQMEEILSQKEKITIQKDEIEQISKKLHELDQAKLRFFANISHELRTPLTLIISPLTRLLKGNVDDNIRNLYLLMLRNSTKLQEMINQLLDISKIDKNELVLNMGMHDLNNQIRITCSMFQPIAEEKNIEFIISGNSENLVFSFDAERLEQIINNLLSNAFKFTPENGKVEVNIAGENETVVIRVRDNGIGITPESLEKVFDRFYQSETTIGRHFGGSGIGLALAKELVELHNGEISVKSEAGKSTEFTVILPLAQKENIKTVVNPDTPKILENNELTDLFIEKTERNINKESVLLVEDNIDLRSYLSQSLSKSYHVLEAKNGIEGIDVAKRKIPDIIISDVMMPETDGYQLTSEIRRTLETCHIPILLLTAKTGRESKIEGLQRGADDYIYKPFDEEELLLKIRNILSKRQKLHDKYKKQITPNPSEIETLSMDEKFIMKLVAIVEKDLSNNKLDVDFLGNNIGLSRQQLYRKLKAITGLTPVEFIRTIRIKRAAQLIKQKTASVSEIAFITGFENLSYFAKRFKEEFGQLPSEYAKSNN